MRARLTTLFTMAVPAIFNSACGNSFAVSGQSLSQAQAVPLVAITQSQLAGAWQSQCETDTDYSWRETLQFSANGTLTRISEDFANSACTGSPELVIQVSESFALTPSSVANASTLQLTVNQITMMPMTSEVASDFNTEAFCGFTDWSASVSKTIPPSNACAGDGSINYEDLISSSGNKIYFSDSTGAAIDTSYGFTRL